MSAISTGAIAPQYVNTDTAAQILGLSRKSLEHLRHRGQGPRYTALGKRCVRYAVSDLQAWMDQHAIQSGGAA